MHDFAALRAGELVADFRCASEATGPIFNLLEPMIPMTTLPSAGPQRLDHVVSDSRRDDRLVNRRISASCSPSFRMIAYEQVELRVPATASA